MSGYIGTQPVPQATQTRDTFTATAGQTSFATGGYTPQFLDVFLNGVHLQNGTDYTASNGSDVVLTTGAALDDVLEVVAFTTFDSANTYNRTEADAEFVNDPNEVITVDGSGKVGINTDSPAEALEISSAGDTTVLVKTTGTGDADAILQLDSADGGESEVLFLHDGVEGARVSWFTDGNPDLNIITNAGTDGVIDFQPNNSLAMRVNAEGKVGINTGSPDEMLHVVGTAKANKFVGSGTIILAASQSDSTNYTTTSQSYQTATRFQITPSSSTSRLLGWFYCQMRATSGQSDGDMANTARVHYLNSSGSWQAISNIAQNLRTENGTSTGLQEIAVTLPILLFSSYVNSSGDWDVSIRHYEGYDATSAIDDGRLYYMEYEP